MPFASINTLATTTPAQVDAQVTMGASLNALVIDFGPQSMLEGAFYLYVRINAGDVIKYEAYRYSRLILSVAAGDEVAIGSDSIRAITVFQGTKPNMTTPTWATAIAQSDESEPRVWVPVAPHVTIGTVKKIVIEAGSGTRDIWLSDYDGSNWSPARWVRTHPTYTGAITVPVFGESVAFCTQDGSQIIVRASSEATVGGTSNPYVLAMPTISATSTVTANDGADFLSKLQAATAGTNVVLPAGTYSLAAQITDGDWDQGVTISGATGDRDDVIIELFDTDLGVSLNDSAAAMRGLRHVTFSITADHGAFHEEGTWIHMHNVRFLGDGTRTGVDNVLVGTAASIIRAHKCDSSNSAADCWNIQDGAGTTVELIACTGSMAGPAIDAQVITSHLSAPLRVMGGSYSDAHTNLYARATGGTCHMEFASIASGTRNAGLLAAFGFGCRNSGRITGVWDDNGTEGYQLFWDIDNGGLGFSTNLARNFLGTFHGNRIANSPSSRQVYYSETTGTPRTSFNVWTGCETASEAIIAHLAGSAGTHEHLCANNTFLNNSGIIGVGNAASGSLNLRNNAMKGTITRTLTNIATPDWTSVTSDYNVYDRPLNVSEVQGTDDIVGSLGVGAELDATLLPTDAGNCDDSAEPDTYDWIGGKGFTGMPLIFAAGTVSRGAVTRPFSGGSIFPDVWNAAAVAESDEDDSPEEPGEGEGGGTTEDNYIARHAMDGGTDLNEDTYLVAWNKNGNSIASGNVTLPFIQVVDKDGASLIAKTAMTVTSGVISYTATDDERMDIRSLYRITYFATIDGEERFHEIPWFVR